MLSKTLFTIGIFKIIRLWLAFGLLLVCSTTQLFSQTTPTPTLSNVTLNTLQELNVKMSSLSTSRAKIPENTMGSAYTNEAFSPAIIYLYEKQLGTVYYRFNAYNQEIEIKGQNIDEEEPQALGKDPHIKLLVDGQFMQHLSFIDKKGKVQNAYLTLIEDGPIKLYTGLKVSYTEAKPAQNSFVPAIPARFTHYEKYYLKTSESGTIQEVVPSKGKFLKQLPSSRKNHAKQFMKENNINIRKEGELVKVIEFLNS